MRYKPLEVRGIYAVAQLIESHGHKFKLAAMPTVRLRVRNSFRWPLDFYTLFTKCYKNQTTLNNEKSSILWEIGQGYFYVS